MVSAGEALGAAVHEGVLEKKVWSGLSVCWRPAPGSPSFSVRGQRRTGGWKKKQFVLTPTQLLYFDSLESAAARSALATLEVLAVQRSTADPQQRGFELVLFRKKKEYRAASTAERDAWVTALSSVAGVKKRGVDDSESLGVRGVEPVADSESSSATTTTADVAFSGPLTLSDLRTLSEQVKRAMAWQLQISKSFTARDVVEALRKLTPGLAHAQLLQIGQDLVDHKLLVPLKSHVFDEHDGGRFKFAEAVAQRQPKNHLAMRAQSIADLMGTPHFDANKYAEDFLRKHASDKIDAHCKKLVAQKVWCLVNSEEGWGGRH
jgi:hypothetical protein